MWVHLWCRSMCHHVSSNAHLIATPPISKTASTPSEAPPIDSSAISDRSVVSRQKCHIATYLDSDGYSYETNQWWQHEHVIVQPRRDITRHPWRWRCNVTSEQLPAQLYAVRREQRYFWQVFYQIQQYCHNSQTKRSVSSAQRPMVLQKITAKIGIQERRVQHITCQHQEATAALPSRYIHHVDWYQVAVEFVDIYFSVYVKLVNLRIDLVVDMFQSRGFPEAQWSRLEAVRARGLWLHHGTAVLNRDATHHRIRK